MASEPLKINIQQMEKQVSAIRQAVDDYTEFGENPFEDEITKLGEMNTDFTAKFKVMLDNLNDGNSNSIAAVEEIAGLADAILNTFMKIDREAVEKMGFNLE